MARLVRIGTTAMCYPDGETESRQRALAFAALAGRSGCDMLLLPEHFYRSDDGGACADRAAQLRLEEALQALAAKHRMYVLAGLPVYSEDGARFNAAVLFDRAGNRRPVYYKAHPTVAEMDAGIVPGGPPSPFDLDFGRIGAQICFDIGWPADWRLLKQQGAELVCWLSAYDGGFPLQAHAWCNHYHVVSSVRSTRARFIDITGRVVAAASRYTPLAIHDVNLDQRLFEMDTDYRLLPAIRERYGTAVRIDGLDEEDVFTVESFVEGKSSDDIVAEFGLETYEAFHARTDEVAAQVRAVWGARQPR